MLINAQEQIPRSVIEGFGFEPANMRVLSAREMIEMYIGEENSQETRRPFVNFDKQERIRGLWDCLPPPLRRGT